MADPNKKIKCEYWGPTGLEEKYLTMFQIADERQRLRREAFKFLAQHSHNPDCKHVVYYRDERSCNDCVWKVHFYTKMIPWNDTVYNSEVNAMNEVGFVAAAHREL